MRRLLVLLVLLFLSESSLAWGTETHEYLCRQAVSSAWSAAGLACLNNVTDSYCNDIKSSCGEYAYQGCLQFHTCIQSYAKGNTIDVSFYPEYVLRDTNSHYDFSTCPIKWLRNNEWICNLTDNPAKAKYDYWFDYAGKANNLCSRVLRFCTGANYYADSKFPLYEVSYLEGCIGTPLADDVDLKVASGERDWSVSKQCSFSILKEFAGVSRKTSSHVTFLVRSGDVDSIAGELNAKAREIARKIYAPPRVPAIPVNLINPVTASSTQTTETTTTSIETSPTSLTIPMPFNETDVDELFDETAGALNETASLINEYTLDVKYKLNMTMLIFVISFVVACLIFLIYVMLHMRRVSMRRKAEAEAVKAKAEVKAEEPKAVKAAGAAMPEAAVIKVEEAAAPAAKPKQKRKKKGKSSE